MLNATCHHPGRMSNPTQPHPTTPGTKKVAFELRNLPQPCPQLSASSIFSEMRKISRHIFYILSPNLKEIYTDDMIYIYLYMGVFLLKPCAHICFPTFCWSSGRGSATTSNWAQTVPLMSNDSGETWRMGERSPSPGERGNISLRKWKIIIFNSAFLGWDGIVPRRVGFRFESVWCKKTWIRCLQAWNGPICFNVDLFFETRGLTKWMLWYAFSHWFAINIDEICISLIHSSHEHLPFLRAKYETSLYSSNDK